MKILLGIILAFSLNACSWTSALETVDSDLSTAETVEKDVQTIIEDVDGSSSSK